MEVLTRRELLQMAFGGSLILASCGRPKPDNSGYRPPTTIGPSAQPGIAAGAATDEKARVIDEINSLPDSPIKSVLLARALPYFQTPLPFVLNRSGLEIRILEIGVKKRYSSALEQSGSISYRGVESGELFYPTAPVTTKLPLIGLTLTSEESRFHPDDFTPDRTPFVSVDLSPRSQLMNGIRPNIEIVSPHPQVVPDSQRQAYTLLEGYGFVKETCSLLYYDIMLEEVFKKMAQFNYLTHLDVVSTNRRAARVEILTPAITAVQASGGRLAAITDLAGYILAMKAFESTEVISALRRASDYVPTLENLKDADFGISAQDIFYGVSKWILENRAETRRLQTFGTMDKLP